MSDDPRQAAYRDAAQAVDRLLGRLGEATEASTTTRMRTQFARAMDLNLDLVRQALDTASAGWPERPSAVTMPPALSGGTSTTLIWVHNHDPEPRTGVEVVGGAVGPVPGGAWSFAPNPIDVPADSAVPVLASLAVPPDAEPGTYEGAVSVGAGSPIIVRIDIHDGEPIPHDAW